MLLHKLKYFIEIAEQRSFTSAASTFYVSQPALSKQVKLLEEEIGFTLFNRSVRGVELTKKGRALFEDLKPLFDQIEKTVGLYKRFDHIRFGSTPMLSSYFLPGYYEKLQYTNLDVTVIQEDSQDFIPLLKEQEIDAAIVQDIPSVEGLHSKFLFEENFVAAIPISYALASKETITIEECFNYTQILPPAGSLSLNVRRMMKEQNVERDVLETHYLGMVGLVSLGIGIAYLPSMMAKEVEHRGVVFIPIKGAPLTRKMYLYAVTSSVLEVLSESLK